jgi:hypothetical protein
MLQNAVMNATEVDRNGTPVSQDCGSIAEAISQGFRAEELSDEDNQFAFDNNRMPK